MARILQILGRGVSVSVCSADPNTLLTVSINATRPPARFECHGARTQPLGARLTMSVGNGGSGLSFDRGVSPEKGSREVTRKMARSQFDG